METYHLDDISFEAPNLDVEDPPPDLPYEQYEDYRSREILRLNGVEPTGEGIISALETQRGPVLAAAAHTAGAAGLQSARSALEDLLSDPDDIVAVEAAYALHRLGADAGAARLVSALDGNVMLDLGPATAAGYLAQLGDDRGVETVAQAQTSELDAVRMTGCKQLYFLVPFHGPDADVVAMFGRALGDPNENIQWQALVQLRFLRWPATGPLIEAYLDHAPEGYVRQVASGVLADLGETRAGG
jgi:HEAT repeat protein